MNLVAMGFKGISYVSKGGFKPLKSLAGGVSFGYTKSCIYGLFTSLNKNSIAVK